MKDNLKTLRFMHNTENVVFIELLGVGKIHRSIALGMRAIMSDIPVYYTSAMKLVQILKRDYDLRRLEYRIRTYSRFRLMIVDEIGYLPLTREGWNGKSKSSTVFLKGKPDQLSMFSVFLESLCFSSSERR